MEIKILYDNFRLDESMVAGWGFSALVGGSVLFDTGENGHSLLENMKAMGVSTDNLSAVVISHDHWDHTGGLWEVLRARAGLKVYGCPGFSSAFKSKVAGLKGNFVALDKMSEITAGVYASGQIAGEYKGRGIAEQALVARDDNRISVITGCSHPGIVEILRKVRESFKSEDLHVVIGGFHLIGQDRRTVNVIVDEFEELGVKKAGPSHCTGDEASEIFRERYGSDFIDVKAGMVMQT